MRGGKINFNGEERGGKWKEGEEFYLRIFFLANYHLRLEN